MLKITFGQHAGTLVKDLPTDYSVWLVGKFWRHPVHDRVAFAAYTSLMERYDTWAEALDAAHRISKRRKAAA